MDNRHICFKSQQDHIIIGYIVENDATGRVRVNCSWVDEDGILQEGKTKVEENFETEFILIPLETFIEEYSYYFRENPLPVTQALKNLAHSFKVYPHFFNQDQVDQLFQAAKKAQNSI